MYLGAEIKKVKTPSRHECWCISSSKYIKYVILTIEEKLQKKNEELPKYCNTPLSYSYQPENDITLELDKEDTTLCKEAIGMLCCAVEIGRYDILFEVSIMSSYMATPRGGHVERLIQIFSYLKHQPSQQIYMDPESPKVSENRFEVFLW